MIIKSKTRPTCAWCGQQLAKKTRLVFVVADIATHKYQDEHIGYVQGPASDWHACMRLTNATVTSVKYRDRDRTTGVSSFTTWDGESYKSTGGYFCNNVCAIDYGTAAAKAGFIPYRRRA